MSIVQKMAFYLKNITFICFLYAAVVLYSGLIKDKIGFVCLIIVIIYSLVTFFMLLVKNKEEESNVFNNIVVSLLHFYFCFITFRYCNSVGFQLVDSNFFTFNYFIVSLSMLVLTFNKFILYKSK